MCMFENMQINILVSSSSFPNTVNFDTFAKFPKTGHRIVALCPSIIYFRLSFALYLIFWVALTFAAVTGVTADDAKIYDKPIDIGRLVCEAAVLLYAVLNLLAEVMQLRL